MAVQPPRIFSGVKLLEPKTIPTPFGTVETPLVELPPLRLPTLEDRHRRALGHAIGTDASDIIALVPYVGGVLADSIRAMHARELRRLLSPQEYERYAYFDKSYPDALAFLRSLLP